MRSVEMGDNWVAAAKAKQEEYQRLKAEAMRALDVGLPMPVWPEGRKDDGGKLPVWPEGRKDDGGKLPYHLLAPEFLDATADILEFGAKKYAPRNWEKGMAWSRPFAALMRHMWAWWRGEKADPETGRSHLWHASACLMFLLAYEQRRIGEDDRPVPPEQAARS